MYLFVVASFDWPLPFQATATHHMANKYCCVLVVVVDLDRILIAGLYPSNQPNATHEMSGKIRPDPTNPWTDPTQVSNSVMYESRT